MSFQLLGLNITESYLQLLGVIYSCLRLYGYPLNHRLNINYYLPHQYKKVRILLNKLISSNKPL